MKKTTLLFVFTSSLLIQSMDNANRPIVIIDLNKPVSEGYQSKNLLQPSDNNGIPTYNLNNISNEIMCDLSVIHEDDFITAQHFERFTKDVVIHTTVIKNIKSGEITCSCLRIVCGQFFFPGDLEYFTMTALEKKINKYEEFVQSLN